MECGRQISPCGRDMDPYGNLRGTRRLSTSFPSQPMVYCRLAIPFRANCVPRKNTIQCILRCIVSVFVNTAYGARKDLQRRADRP